MQTDLFEWKAALEDEKNVGVVFLDIKRAFDTINRKLHLPKLSKYKFDILKLFKDYLSGRVHPWCTTGDSAWKQETIFIWID